VYLDPEELAARAEQAGSELGRPVAGFEALVASIREGGIDEREWTYVRRDGSRFPVQLAVSALRDDGGRLLGFIGMAQDISLRQAADREIRDLNTALQQTIGELESFSYSVSHDLRAPLRHVDGYARMLAEELGDGLAEEPRRFLDAIGRSSRRMGALIDDLLALSRLGRKPLTREQVDMALLAEESWREVSGDIRGAPRFVLGPLPGISGDPALLRQVWINLLSNAIKYSAGRGSDAVVEVFSERLVDSVTYMVRDNGVGFDARYADKLFGAFQRLHPQDEFEGTGVGLAIVHRIVVRHGGTVRAESDVGCGACFMFDLPQRDGE
jgi:light-regulated signal transduction histidine kinase (bacteriophytochrome)